MSSMAALADKVMTSTLGGFTAPTSTCRSDLCARYEGRSSRRVCVGGVPLHPHGCSPTADDDPGGASGERSLDGARRDRVTDFGGQEHVLTRPRSASGCSGHEGL